MKDGATIIEIGTTILPEADYIYDFSFPMEEGKPNPHLGTDTGYPIKVAAAMCDAFTTYENQVNDLDGAVRKDQQTVPAGNLKLFTHHDAYADFAKNFGSEVLPSKVLEEIGRATGAAYEHSHRDDDLPGAPDEAGHSWLGLMKENDVAMIMGLGGQTPNIDAVLVESPVPNTAVYPQ